MTVDAFFERSELEDRIEVERLRLFHFAFDRNGPWGWCGSFSPVASGLVLTSAELIKVVVIGDVLVRRQLLIRAEWAFDDAAQFGFGAGSQGAGQRSDSERASGEEPGAGSGKPGGA